MDDFLVVGYLFDSYLENLRNTLWQYEEFNILCYWKMCHFMEKECIVVVKKISAKGTKVY